MFPYAVQDGDTVVGFVLLDKDHQGKGYGRAIVEELMARFEADSRFDVLIADYVKGNNLMCKLLESLGFEYGDFNEENNEYVMKLDKTK